MPVSVIDMDAVCSTVRAACHVEEVGERRRPDITSNYYADSTVHLQL